MLKYGIRVNFEPHSWLWVLSPKADISDSDPEKLLFDTYEEAEQYAKAAWRLQGKEHLVIIEEVHT